MGRGYSKKNRALEFLIKFFGQFSSVPLTKSDFSEEMGQKQDSCIFKVFGNMYWYELLINGQYNCCNTSFTKGEKMWCLQRTFFQQCKETGKFPIEWRRTNIFLVQKKCDRKILKIYRRVSLLPSVETLLRNSYSMECSSSS